MDLEFAGRIAVVIGGSSGIGAAVAGVLAEEGCDVAATYGGREAVPSRRRPRRGW